MSSDNKRIYYACQAVAISDEGWTSSNDLTTDELVHGVQSVGITTNFNLEQAFELGQIEIYENIEGTPDVEVTLEKVIDGYPLIYHMATTGVIGASQTGLAARADRKCDLRLGIFDAASNNVAAADENSGNSEVEVYCSGMYVSSVSYTVPVDGNATESVTLVGNNKQWLAGANTKIVDASVSGFDGTDQPFAIGTDDDPKGGVQRREDVMLNASILPTTIFGKGQSLIGSGYGNALVGGTGDPLVHIQNFTCSVDLGREDILEFGRKTPYFRPATFPVEVTSEFEVISTSGDWVSAYETGNSDLYNTSASGDNLRNECIFLTLRCGVAFDLGNKNKLTSVSYAGGDAGGGNVSSTFSYSNYNVLDVQDYTHQNYIGFGAVTLGNGAAGGAAKEGKGVVAFDLGFINEP